MSLIDEVISKKLPRGQKLTPVGAGSIDKKVREATRTGLLKNLGDNQEIVVKTIKDNLSRFRGEKITGLEAERLWKKAIKADPTLTKDDKGDFKAILKHMSKAGAPKPSAEAAKKTAPSAKATKQAARVAAKKAQLKKDPTRGALPEFLEKRRGSVSVKANPWAANPNKPGGSGGIGSGLGGGSTISNSPSSGGAYKPPSLLR
ncbi:MAG: hypothetical protein HOE19_00725 [Candidatus Komeilibacteria bacterium]|jgi:hypothetical protein|nr:hypothetical protein [Candidatus Komeilibacteria bacterium]MBT4447346.1 hypothetical protein [Candidatus Komeilibacteria bacterium]